MCAPRCSQRVHADCHENRKNLRMKVCASRRRVIVGALTLVAATGCASLDPRAIMLSQSELQSLLERQFPRQQRVMELLDVSLTKPSLRLVPERNRIVTALDLAATERLSGRSLRGSLAIEHALRFEPSDATVRLANVKVDAIQLELAGTPLSGQAARLGGLLAERLLDDFVIYRVGDDKRAMLARSGVNNADVAVTGRGVELKFRP
jgi:hypothetical protein